MYVFGALSTTKSRHLSGWYLITWQVTEKQAMWMNITTGKEERYVFWILWGELSL